jgi:hypothetical protein
LLNSPIVLSGDQCHSIEESREDRYGTSNGRVDGFEGCVEVHEVQRRDGSAHGAARGYFLGEVASNSLAAIQSFDPSAGNRIQRRAEGDRGMTLTRQHGHRTGQNTGQRNTTITPEMEANKWQPGQSGNPGGRPKKTPITDELRALMEELYSGKERRFKGLTNSAR